MAATAQPISSSTGPRTPEGKARSSANSLKHGLFAESPILPGEDPAPFEAFRSQFLQDFAPATLIETQLTGDLANLRWRLLRCQSLENAILADAALSVESQIDALAKFSLYEHRLTRKFTQTLKQLQELQAIREARRQSELSQAIAIAADCKATATPFDPAAYGFVFSIAEIEVLLHRRQRLESAAQRGFFATPKRNRTTA